MTQECRRFGDCRLVNWQVQTWTLLKTLFHEKHTAQIHTDRLQIRTVCESHQNKSQKRVLSKKALPGYFINCVETAICSMTSARSTAFSSVIGWMRVELESALERWRRFYAIEFRMVRFAAQLTDACVAIAVRVRLLRSCR